MKTTGGILLVEDNQDDIFLVRLGFKKAGFDHSIIVVTDGAQAINYLRGDGDYGDRTRFPVPQLMLLDLNLPAESGFRVLSWVRQRPQWKCLPIIVLTSSHYGKDIERCYDLGANSFLTKPSNLEEWMSAVKQTCQFWLGTTRLPQPGPFLDAPTGQQAGKTVAQRNASGSLGSRNPKLSQPLRKTRGGRPLRG